MAGNATATDMAAAEQPQTTKAKTTDDMDVKPNRPTLTRSLSDPVLSSTGIASGAGTTLPEEEQGTGQDDDQQEALPGYDPIKLPAYDLDTVNEASRPLAAEDDDDDEDSPQSTVVATSPANEYESSGSEDGEQGGTALDQARNEVRPADLDRIPTFPGGPASGTLVRSLVDASVWYYVL
ncbi:MAG: hypothetical protein L6R42_001326 [Xanthoria sp. 1 TBL-2021]|nr:MAG: hypothetical protein L6R42_001326 [Xanthoria sp. 1 TBL-2021]